MEITIRTHDEAHARRQLRNPVEQHLAGASGFRIVILLVANGLQQRLNPALDGGTARKALQSRGVPCDDDAVGLWVSERELHEDFVGPQRALHVAQRQRLAWTAPRAIEQLSRGRSQIRLGEEDLVEQSLALGSAFRAKQLQLEGGDVALAGADFRRLLDVGDGCREEQLQQRPPPGLFHDGKRSTRILLVRRLEANSRQKHLVHAADHPASDPRAADIRQEPFEQLAGFLKEIIGLRILPPGYVQVCQLGEQTRQQKLFGHAPGHGDAILERFLRIERSVRGPLDLRELDGDFNQNAAATGATRQFGRSREQFQRVASVCPLVRDGALPQQKLGLVPERTFAFGDGESRVQQLVGFGEPLEFHERHALAEIRHHRQLEARDGGRGFERLVVIIQRLLRSAQLDIAMPEERDPTDERDRVAARLRDGHRLTQPGHARADIAEQEGDQSEFPARAIRPSRRRRAVRRSPALHATIARRERGPGLRPSRP